MLRVGPGSPRPRPPTQRAACGALPGTRRGPSREAGPHCRHVSRFLSSSAPQWSCRAGTHTCACTRTHARTQPRTCTHTCTQAHTHTRTPAHTLCVHTHLHTCTRMCSQTYTHAWTYLTQGNRQESYGPGAPPTLTRDTPSLSPLSQQGGVAGPVHLGVTQTPRESSRHGVRGGSRGQLLALEVCKYLILSPAPTSTHLQSPSRKMLASKQPCGPPPVTNTPCFFWF